MKKTIGVILASLVVTSLVLTITQLLIAAEKTVASPNARAQDGKDWPQLQRDPQRTGYTPDEVRPPYVYLWKWNEVPFASRVQPVVVSGRLFIGGLDGVMYARSAKTGALLWTFATGGPIRHSAAVHEGRVFFGSYDGSVYALDAVRGSLNWRYQTGAGVATAPAVANDAVCFGSTDGVFYALSTDDGSLLWSYDVGVPILTSAALSVDSSTVYFGAEDITAYALNAADGSLRWATRLQGQSLADRWPVVVGDVVIYRSQSLHHFHNLLHEGDDVMDEAGAIDPNWAIDWAQVRPEIIDFLTANPDRQTFFVLDADTGDLRGPVPVLYTYGNGDAPGPPAVRDAEIYTLFRARHGIQNDAGSVHVTTIYDAALGRMNLNTLDIAGLTLAPGEEWHLQYRATSDEPAMLSMAGSMLFVDTWTRLGGIDVDTGELFEVANVADYWPECDVNCVGRSGPMPFFNSYPFPGPRVDEGRAYHAAVIADGVIYWRVLSGGLAAIGHSTGARSDEPCQWPLPEPAGERSGHDIHRPSALSSSPEAQSLADYVWTEPVRPVPYANKRLVAQLEEDVLAIVDAGHLAPFFIERGFTTPQGIPGDSAHPEDGLASFQPGNVYWFDPGELVYTLSIAYPYLSDDVKSQVRSYLQSEMGLYPPLEPLPWPPDWLTAGARRESYSMTVSYGTWPPPTPPLSTLYALWTYADATDDWSYLEDRWSQVKALFEGKRSEVDSYAAISGAMGYARIAAHLGHMAEAQEGENVAVAAMTAGQDFLSFLATASERYPDPRGQMTGLRAPVFFGLVPEVGRFLRDTNSHTVSHYLDTLTDYYDGEYLWYLTRLGLQKETGESSFHGPELAWSVFLAKTYIQDINAAELHCYLDRPWSLGDIYYLQKLVALIEANWSPDFSPSTKQASNSIPAAGEVITYAVVLRNSGVPVTSTVFVTDEIPVGLNYVSGSVSVSLGSVDYVDRAVLWNSVLSSTSVATLVYEVTVEGTAVPGLIINTATIDAGEHGTYARSVTVFVKGYPVYMPLILKSLY